MKNITITTILFIFALFIACEDDPYQPPISIKPPEILTPDCLDGTIWIRDPNCTGWFCYDRHNNKFIEQHFQDSFCHFIQSVPVSETVWFYLYKKPILFYKGRSISDSWLALSYLNKDTMILYSNSISSVSGPSISRWILKTSN